MSIELLEMSPTEFFQRVNVYRNLGDISILDHTEVNGSLDDLQPEDIVIYYDFCTDEAGHTAANEFSDWIFGDCMTLIYQYMADIGYEIVDEQDGSADGLYYGLLQFRKAR